MLARRIAHHRDRQLANFQFADLDMAAQRQQRLVTLARVQGVEDGRVFEVSVFLKRCRVAKRSEELSPDHGRHFDDLLDSDLAAIKGELKAN